MFYRERFCQMGSTYFIVDGHDYRRSPESIDRSLEPVPRVEARWVLEKIVRGEPQLFARLYVELTGQHRFAQGTIANTEALSARIRQAFGVDRPAADHSSAPDLARFYLLRRRRGERPVAVRQQSPEAQRIDEALARLGRRPFTHRGQTYYLQRAGGNDVPLPGRDSYETLSEAQLFAVLGALPDDPGLDAAKKGAAQELLAASKAQRMRDGTTELILLVRQRSHVRALEASGPTITPSQLRKALERHWIEVAAVDPDGKPVPSVVIDLQLADGTTQSVATNEDGFARLDAIDAGSVLIRLPEIDGRAWRAAGAKPSGKTGPERTHVVQKGECLTKIAHARGLTSWRELWESPKNAELRRKRKSPNILYPGDNIVVPGIQINQIARATDASHTVTILPTATVDLIVRLRGESREALANEAFELHYSAQGKDNTLRGSLDAEGTLKATLPVNSRDVVLRLPALGFACALTVGGLDPVRNEDDQSVLKSGVKGRLYALGYLPTEEASDDDLRIAVCDYQRNEMNQVDATGELDGATLDSLVETYGA